MHYIHTVYTLGGGFGLYSSGSGIGAWNNVGVAKTVWDYGCPFTGTHAHEYLVSVALQSSSENRSRYNIVGDYCIPQPCNSYRNDIEANWTRKALWYEGH